MPLGFERRNERRRQPNRQINFIKPLEGPNKALAEDFLERVAAICYPVMKVNHLSVMSLEEFEPNREFVGRNFNAGEVIQLVLRTQNGQWLPFRYVQMVMMHELAHCKQMNHSRSFWKVRNGYANELRALWQRQYTGEGFWSRGRTLLSGEYESDAMPDPKSIPESLCGGVYLRGRRRRNPLTSKLQAPAETNGEKKRRRIEKKFGKAGVALGGDESVRTQLEAGKSRTSRPRVANSARGRELRLAAAALRLQEGASLEDPTAEADQVQYISDDSDASEHSDLLSADGEAEAFAKVLECDNGSPDEFKNEIIELENLTPPKKVVAAQQERACKVELAEPPAGRVDTLGRLDISSETLNLQGAEKSKRNPAFGIASSQLARQECPTCSFFSSSDSITCTSCGNVLDLRRINSYWRCKSSECRQSKYVNAGDYGKCSVCGAARATNDT